MRGAATISAPPTLVNATESSHFAPSLPPAPLPVAPRPFSLPFPASVGRGSTPPVPIKIISWNVNSIRARHDRLLALLARHEPDALCLQELKLEEAKFPWEDVRSAGYHAVCVGLKSYNGVAILSRTEPEDVRRGMGDGVDDAQARLISARVGGIRVFSAYFPNGSTPASDKYTYKLAWMERLGKKLRAAHAPTS